MAHINSIRTLEKILRKAVNEGDAKQAGGATITSAMGLKHNASNLVPFFGILSRAEEDIQRLKGIDDFEEVENIITDLESNFIAGNIWGNQWGTFRKYIKEKNILTILKYLSKDFSQLFHEILLEEDFMKELKLEFSTLLEKVINSDLAQDSKLFFVEKLEDILVAIERYRIDGTKGLRIVNQSILWNLYKGQQRVSEDDKRKPIWGKVCAAFIALETVTSAWNLAETFIDPKIDNYRQNHRKFEQIISELADLPDVSNSFNTLPQLTPASTDLQEIEESDKD